MLCFKGCSSFQGKPNFGLAGSVECEGHCYLLRSVGFTAFGSTYRCGGGRGGRDLPRKYRSRIHLMTTYTIEKPMMYSTTAVTAPSQPDLVEIQFYVHTALHLQEGGSKYSCPDGHRLFSIHVPKFLRCYLALRMSKPNLH